jgi:hypothetical protein
MYLIIGHRFGELGRGGYHIPKRFCEEHSECVFKEDKRSRLEYVYDKYDKIILWTQVPRCYTIPVNFIRLRKFKYLFYLRSEYISPLYDNNCTNGFYYYKADNRFENYIPMITDFPIQENKVKQETLGFYVRKSITPDSFDWFVDFLSSLNRKVDVWVMGEEAPEIEHHNNVLNYNHTYDNVQFFSSITHYFYPTSKYFTDPFPHSILEAVQAGCQIVLPKIERTHKDGIDDLKDCIKWHEKFDPDKILDNSDCILTASNFSKFYQKVFENNFEYRLDRKYKRWSDWIEHEI